MKLGKLPARKDAVKLKFSAYASGLPAAPKSGGHKDLIGFDANMFGNDRWGDCVCAEAGHGTLLYNKLAGKTVNLSTDNVLAMYSAVTGFNPSDPSTDQGTDMQAAASYRLKTGLADVQGNRHKIGAYLDLGTGSVEQVKQAIYYFNGAGIGFQFPDYAMDQFNAGQTWHLKSGGTIDGGHDVLAFYYDSRYLWCFSWGKPIKMSWGFFKKYCDEALVYLSPEALTNGISKEGFNIVQLQADMAQLK